MTIFAEVQDHWVAVLAVVGPIIGAGALAGLREVWKLLDRREANRKVLRAEHKEDEQTIVDHYRTLNERMDREKTELEAEIDVVRDNVMLLLGHVRYLEGILESKGVQFRSFDMTKLTPTTRNRLHAENGEDDT